jgi:hypothetical protein
VPRSRTAVVVLTSALVLASGCGGDDDDDDAASSATTTTTSTTSGTGSVSDDTTPAELADYVGLTVEDATAKAAAEGRPARVIEEDGEGRPVTMDFNPDRLNFVVVDGAVTKVSTG